MAPNDDQDWLNESESVAYSFVENRLRQPVLKEARQKLVEAAVSRSGQIAASRMHSTPYFAHRYEFMRWRNLIAYREALRLVLEVRAVQAAVSAIKPERSAVLRWAYIDQLSEEDLARMLRLSLLQRINFDRSAAQQRIIDVYQELCRLILPHHRSQETDDAGRFVKTCWIFPSPPTLSTGAEILIEQGRLP
jgi:hypothetical protein